MSLIQEDFLQRGLIELLSAPELWPEIEKGALPFYTGFDPTAKSLQIGNLFAIVTMRRLQLHGLKPYAILGGATGMIGDPSGKSAERNLLNDETLQANVAAQRGQLETLLDFSEGPSGAVLLNNHDWLGAFSFLEFLRDVGKRFRLGEMIAKESVKRRMESPEGISFTEFSYQMLQAYDFLHLYRTHGIRLQIGGSDQWGNITAGIDLIRKLEGAQAFGLVIPLVTDSQGKKFGKSEGGTIYLDPEMTSPYQMYQYLLNSGDDAVIPYLNYFTFLEREEIDALQTASVERPHERAAQKALAEAVVTMVHGSDALATAQAATRVLFGEAVENLSDKDLKAIFADVPSVSIAKDSLADGINVLDLLTQTPLFKSKGEARRTVQQNGAYINNAPLEGIEQTITTANLASETCLVIRKGKKNYCLVQTD